MCLLEFLDGVRLLQQIPELVDTLGQAIARERVDRVHDDAPVGQRQLRRRHVDVQLDAGIGDQVEMTARMP